MNLESATSQERLKSLERPRATFFQLVPPSLLSKLRTAWSLLFWEIHAKLERRWRHSFIKLFIHLSKTPFMGYWCFSEISMAAWSANSVVNPQLHPESSHQSNISGSIVRCSSSKMPVTRGPNEESESGRWPVEGRPITLQAFLPMQSQIVICPSQRKCWVAWRRWVMRSGKWARKFIMALITRRRPCASPTLTKAWNIPGSSGSSNMAGDEGEDMSLQRIRLAIGLNI